MATLPLAQGSPCDLGWSRQAHCSAAVPQTQAIQSFALPSPLLQGIVPTFRCNASRSSHLASPGVAAWHPHGVWRSTHCPGIHGLLAGAVSARGGPRRTPLFRVRIPVDFCEGSAKNPGGLDDRCGLLKGLFVPATDATDILLSLGHRTWLPTSGPGFVFSSSGARMGGHF